jgi:hypothetical protein
MDKLKFQQVLDLAPPSSPQFRGLDHSVDKDAVTPGQQAGMFAANASAATPEPIVQQPQINATVLELDRSGRIVSSGTVLMSPQYPHGVIVPVDSDFHTTAVRWRQWDDSGWYTTLHAEGDQEPLQHTGGIDLIRPGATQVYVQLPIGKVLD